MLSSTTLPRTNKSTASYISDAAAIKEFYTAVSLVNNQEIQNRIHKAMDTIITSWTKRHDDMIKATNELEYSYVTLQHESQAESTMYHKCMRDLQFYKAKCDLISYNGSQYHHKQQQHQQYPSSLPFDRRSYFSIDSCGRSTVATSVSNTSKTIYSRSNTGKSSYLGHSSLDSFYYPASSIASSRRPSIVSSTQSPEDDTVLGDGQSMQKEKINLDDNDNDDTFDIASVFEHCYPTHIPSPKPPPADDLPLPPVPPHAMPSAPSTSSLLSSKSSITLPTEILTSSVNQVENDSNALVSVPSPPSNSPNNTQGQNNIETPPTSNFSLVPQHMPSPLAVAEELKFACGDGFWHTIAKGKSNKTDVDTLIKNYLNRGGRPNVANNSGTIKLVKEGYGLIHALLVVRNTHALRRILEAGANPNALPLVKNEKDMISPLVLAASLGYMNGVRLLIECAHVNVLASKGPRQKNALFAAIEADSLNVVMYLLRVCRKLLDQVDDIGATALHYASMAGKTRMVTFLVRECGQVIDSVDYKGETPLHYALRNRHARVAAKLVDDLGADPNVIKKIPTPLELAKSGGLRPIMAMVRTINNNLK